MRRLLIAGATLTLLAGAFVAGPPAHADSYKAYCADSWPTTTEVPSPGPYLAVEWYDRFVTDNGATGEHTFVVVCYSDTPESSPSSAIGGAIVFGLQKTAPDTHRVEVSCRGDSPAWLATVNCNTDSYVTTTTGTTVWKPSATVAASGTFIFNGSTLSLGTTGASTGTITETTHEPTAYATYGGTCATVAGMPVPGTSCTNKALDADVAKGDVPTAFYTGTTGACLVNIGGCQLYQPRAGVVVFDDTASNTQVTLLDVPIVNDPGRACVGFGC